MEGLPSDERRTLRTSWIKYSDFLKSMERKRRLEEKLVSFCGYVIFIVSVCVTCALAVRDIRARSGRISIISLFHVSITSHK